MICLEVLQLRQKPLLEQAASIPAELAISIPSDLTLNTNAFVGFVLLVLLLTYSLSHHKSATLTPKMSSANPQTETKPHKCVHKGCGKQYTNPSNPPCIYHPGPPEFHEGQKGWMCCKPRVLTFDEFLEIPPCTTGEHSAVDDTPAPPKKEVEDAPRIKPVANGKEPGRKPVSQRAMESLSASIVSAGTPRSTSPAPPVLEEDSDPEDLPMPPPRTSCKRKACGKSYDSGVKREDELCVYHPGAPLFHEGSKGWTCCKRKVLEFEEFMKIEGCTERKGHCYVGKKEEEDLEDVRSDFYQTQTSVIVSFYLKKIVKERARVAFEDGGKVLSLDLPTGDGKRFKKDIELWDIVDSKKSSSKIMGTKLEVGLVKTEEMVSWPVLRAGDRETGERIQVGRAGRA